MPADTTDADPPAASVAAAVGEQLRAARDTLGWTRAEMVDRLPFPVHVQTVAGYERGSVHTTSTRFVQLCLTMGVSPPDVLAWAMQRDRVGLDVVGIQVDLRAVLADKAADRLPLRRWARARLARDNDGVARLDVATVRELAMALGYEPDDFGELLCQYTPAPVPKRR